MNLKEYLSKDFCKILFRNMTHIRCNPNNSYICYNRKVCAKRITGYVIEKLSLIFLMDYNIK